MKDSQTDIPPNISAPAKRALEGAGYVRLLDLTKVSEAEVLILHGMGPKALGIIKQEMKNKGLSFKQE